MSLLPLTIQPDPAGSLKPKTKSEGRQRDYSRHGACVSGNGQTLAVVVAIAASTVENWSVRTLVLYRFRYFDPLWQRWLQARHVLEAPEIRCRYGDYELVGAPEIRYLPDDPWRSLSTASSLNSRVNFLRGVYSIQHLLKSVLLSLRCPSNVGNFSAAKSGPSSTPRIAVIRAHFTDVIDSYYHHAPGAEGTRGSVQKA